MVTEDCDTDHSAGEVIDHDGDPPTEWPRLGKSERKPRNPKAGYSGYGGEVDVPDIIGMSSRDGSCVHDDE